MGSVVQRSNTWGSITVKAEVRLLGITKSYESDFDGVTLLLVTETLRVSPPVQSVWNTENCTNIRVSYGAVAPLPNLYKRICAGRLEAVDITSAGLVVIQALTTYPAWV